MHIVHEVSGFRYLNFLSKILSDTISDTSLIVIVKVVYTKFCFHDSVSQFLFCDNDLMNNVCLF